MCRVSTESGPADQAAGREWAAQTALTPVWGWQTPSTWSVTQTPVSQYSHSDSVKPLLTSLPRPPDLARGPAGSAWWPRCRAAACRGRTVSSLSPSTGSPSLLLSFLSSAYTAMISVLASPLWLQEILMDHLLSSSNCFYSLLQAPHFHLYWIINFIILNNIGIRNKTANHLSIQNQQTFSTRQLCPHTVSVWSPTSSCSWDCCWPRDSSSSPGWFPISC